MTLRSRYVSAGQSEEQSLALPAAALWDMDGTLIDTEPYWIAAEIELVESFGGVWTHEDGYAMVGNPMSVAVTALRGRGVDLPDEEIADFLNGRVRAAVAAGVPWQPGAQEILRALHDAGVPMALVTSSFRVLAQPFAEVVGLFDVVVSGDDVARPKPDPEPYLTAARLLGVPVERCVALEDSRSGVASAVASGARVVAVEVMQELEDREGLSRVRSLADLSLADLARIAAGDVLDLRPAA
ncbi:HAD-superfamily hydrolase, subfamily IA, variant 3 [Cellulomonas fimi ATCC 484]|uniref:HAD-superfamily hydrolase, subfamily IA, variant 3 n=1 Tax=Cellulomonas fimi (strain ATCC 484 / DSM 20113 / JCM 1341 / CCUG 24087 / LMG 16345 / NBRC 15513 / NCIMB 8980 / NCTC 7547 / NRS-133) TaxID=590998 RepID=F4GYC7_CELFA|nr:HAD family phosphatase [Cellulomonas fimi]AEE45916.1 HAD-superfamily hydrolase, subfamily IA, variant 3 [Cellulomonas fimi ATCC 484]